MTQPKPGSVGGEETAAQKRSLVGFNATPSIGEKTTVVSLL